MVQKFRFEHHLVHLILWHSQPLELLQGRLQLLLHLLLMNLKVVLLLFFFLDPLVDLNLKVHQQALSKAEMALLLFI